MADLPISLIGVNKLTCRNFQITLHYGFNTDSCVWNAFLKWKESKTKRYKRRNKIICHSELNSITVHKRKPRNAKICFLECFTRTYIWVITSFKSGEKGHHLNKFTAKLIKSKEQVSIYSILYPSFKLNIYSIYPTNGKKLNFSVIYIPKPKILNLWKEVFFDVFLRTSWHG